MSFPRNMMWGPDGEQWNSYLDQRFRLGTKLIINDKTFRFVQAGATALVAGTVQQQQAPVANHVNLTTAAAAIGATAFTVTLGATTAVANMYADGMANISVTPGQGYSYRIASNPAANTSATMALTLAPGNSIQVALTTSSKTDLIINPFSSLIQTPITLSAVPLGIAMIALGAGSYGWIQTGGVASVLTDGTVVVGDPVTTSSGVAGTGTAGAVRAITLATQAFLGQVTRVSTTTNYSDVLLKGLEL